MKVKELIEQLQQLDPEMEVKLWDRDYGYEGLGRVCVEPDRDGEFVSFETEGI